MTHDQPELQMFINTIWSYYKTSGRRDLPWRAVTADGYLDPYAVLVSEIMLQQTQVPRVVDKFTAFMGAFPMVQDLAEASLADVLRLWSGLGYNRRAKFLWQAAGVIVHEHDGRVPDDLKKLVALPGVGPNTAGAVLAYAYNRPVTYIETNIRSVFIHHFFPKATKVLDAELLPLITASLPAQTDQVRQWYWALMDYGTYIKRSVGNTARVSAAYSKQSPFHGSRRKIRGQVLKQLNQAPATLPELDTAIQDQRLSAVLDDLEKEGFISQQAGLYALAA